ncbi:unnamed protein product, partial [Notodromas monacha]
ILLAPAGIIMGLIFYFPYSHFYFIQQGARTDQASDTLNVGNAINVWTAVRMVPSILACCLLIMGAIKEEKKLLRPWLAWVALNCVFGLGCLVALIACARRALIANNDVGLMWTQIFLVLIEGLMFPVVYAYHKRLCRDPVRYGQE